MEVKATPNVGQTRERRLALPHALQQRVYIHSEVPRRAQNEDMFVG